MIELVPKFFVGNENDFERIVRYEADWHVVHACKEPYHRQALGYQGRAAPKHHPEYLIARRGHRLILNLIDAPDPAYVPREIIDAALEFIDEALKANSRVLVHCNEGFSRAPSIAFLYLVAYTSILPINSIDDALRAFSQIYRDFNPSSGLRGFVRINFESYSQRVAK